MYCQPSWEIYVHLQPHTHPYFLLYYNNFCHLLVESCTTKSIMKNGPLNIILRKRNFINRNFLIYSFPYLYVSVLERPSHSIVFMINRQKGKTGEEWITEIITCLMNWNEFSLLLLEFFFMWCFVLGVRWSSVSQSEITRIYFILTWKVICDAPNVFFLRISHFQNMCQEKDSFKIVH